MNNNAFTKDHTLGLKGIAILLMTYGHLFSYAAGITYPIQLESLNFRIIDTGRMIYLASVGRICVTIFAFLTAYGYAVKAKAGEGKDGVVLRNDLSSIKRCIVLILYFIPVYLLSLIIIAIKNNKVLAYTYGTGINGLINGVIDGLGLTDVLSTATLNTTWWYMSFAILSFLLMPILYRWYKNDRLLVVLILYVLIPYIIRDNVFYRYLLSDIICLPLGICFAEEDLFARTAQITVVKRNRIADKTVKFIIYMIMIAALLELRLHTSMVFITDPWLSIIIAVIYYEFLSRIKPLNYLLILLGRYSRDMWLCQYAVIFVGMPGLIYGLKEPIVIFAVSMTVILAVAVMIGFIEKITGYIKVIEKIKL